MKIKDWRKKMKEEHDCPEITPKGSTRSPMSEAKLSPAARIVVNPWDAERNRLQEQVIEAALAYTDTEVGDDALQYCVKLITAAKALRGYTASKHHAAKTMRS